MRPACNSLGRAAERGFALVMAMWMLAVLALLSVGYASWVMKEHQQSVALRNETRARVLAQAAVYKAMGDIVDDRPQTATVGIVLSEINFRPLVPNQLRVNGYWSGGSGQLAIFNASTDTVDLSSFIVDDDAPIGTPDTYLSGTLGPGAVVWLNAITTYGISNSAATITIYETGATGLAWEGRDSWVHPTFGVNERRALLPDGGLSSDGSDSGTSYWVKGPFQHIPAAAPATADEPNGRGVWMDGVAIKTRRGASTLDATFTFPNGAYFLRHARSILVANAIGTSPSGGETTIRTGGAGFAWTDTIPYISHLVTNADSISFSLLRGGASISESKRLDFTSGSARYVAQTLSDSMYADAGVASPGSVNGAVSSLVPFLSEIHDASGATVTNILGNPDLEGNWTDHTDDGRADSWTEIGSSAPLVTSVDHDEVFSRSATHSYMLDELVTTVNSRGMRGETVSVIAGRTYNYGVFGRLEQDGSTGAAGDARLKLYVQWFNATDGLITTSSQADTTWTAYGAWREFRTNDTVAPTGATKAVLRMDARSSAAGSNGQDVYLDDAFFELQPLPGAYNQDEFVEISLGADPGFVGIDNNASAGVPARRREFIEIVNASQGGIDLPANDYYINVGDPADGSSTRRYIVPMFATSATLGAGKFAIIVPSDFTQDDSKTLGVPAGTPIYGLTTTTGGATATQTYLARTRGLMDTGEVVILGRTAATVLVQGASFPAPDSAGRTWQKIDTTKADDITTPYSAWSPSPADNWAFSPKANNGNPGIGPDPTNAVDAYDVDPWADSDASWIQLGGGHMMYEVFDEGAKIRLNSAPRDLIWRVLTYDARSPFYTSATPYPQDSSGTVKAGDAFKVAEMIIHPVWRNANMPRFITTAHSFYIHADSAAVGRRNVDNDNARLLTAYGDTSSFRININYCLLDDQKAVYMAGMVTAGVSSTDANAIFDDFQKYVLGADRKPGGTGINADNHYNSITEMSTLTPTSATLTDAVKTTLAGLPLATYFTTQSSHFFTVVGTGAVFRGAGPTSSDTVALRKVMAVIRRSTTSDQGRIVYWRNVWDDGITIYK